MSLKKGFVGSIQSTFWRRVVLVVVGVPFMVLGLLPTYALAFPGAFAAALFEAWMGFVEVMAATYRQPNMLMVLATKRVWSKEWSAR